MTTLSILLPCSMMLLSGSIKKNNTIHFLKNGLYQLRIENKNHDVYVEIESDSMPVAVILGGRCSEKC